MMECECKAQGKNDAEKQEKPPRKLQERELGCVLPEERRERREQKGDKESENTKDGDWAG